MLLENSYNLKPENFENHFEIPNLKLHFNANTIKNEKQNNL